MKSPLSIKLEVEYHNGQPTWNATAYQGDSPEYDTGAAVCRTPLEAAMALAMVLYQEVAGMEVVTTAVHAHTAVGHVTQIPER